MKPPIADPFEIAPLQPRNQRVFRVNLFRSFIGYFCFHFLILAPILWPAVAQPQSNNGLYVVAFVVFTALVASVWGWWSYPVKIIADGLRGNGFWGAKRQLVWPDITNVRWGWFLCSFAVISTSRTRNFIWLPLILRDTKAFARAVEELAPADNPLRLFLQKRGFLDAKYFNF